MTQNTLALGCALIIQNFVFGAIGISNPDSTEIIELKSDQLIVGQADRTLYTLDGSDSSVITMGYAYYSIHSGLEMQAYQKTFNALVYENTLWETLADIDAEKVKESFDNSFFENRLDSVAAIHKSEQIEYKYDQLWYLSTKTEVHEFFPQNM